MSIAKTLIASLLGMTGAEMPSREGGKFLWFKQLWFAGNHADIGGDYPENESRLSDMTMQWMLDEAQSLPNGLLTDRSVLLAALLGSDAVALARDLATAGDAHRVILVADLTGPAVGVVGAAGADARDAHVADGAGLGIVAAGAVGLLDVGGAGRAG